MKKLAKWILPIMGFLFITAYIRSATVDVVYTDYIRLVNQYLPNALSFEPYLHADILARVPISYLERIISTYVFGYSTTFDMIMGAVGLTLSAVVLTNYCSRRNLSLGIILALLFLNFSLDKWEMLTNGTGWMHFWAFALFYWHYDIYDRLRGSEGVTAAVNVSRDETLLKVLPFVTILLFAGPYCAIYAGAMGIVYVVDYFTKNYDTAKTSKKDWLWRAICLAVPFILYFISEKLTAYEYSGATDETLIQVIAGDPTMIPKMVLKSFASMVIGGETAMEYGISNTVIYLMGLFIIASYVYAIIVNIKSGLYKKTAFPMLLILSGLVSHAIVLWGRWIFKNPDYMMSSRYALQFQSGIFGIILTLYMAWKYKDEECRNMQSADEKDKDVGTADGSVKTACGMHTWEKIACIVIFVVIIGGHLVTTGREINMAKYRKEAFENKVEVALNYENEDDATLKAVLQYSKPDMTRSALKILQDARLNVFRE